MSKFKQVMSQYKQGDTVIMTEGAYRDPFTVTSPLNITLCPDTGVATLVVVISPINIESFKAFVKREHGIDTYESEEINVSVSGNRIELATTGNEKDLV